MRIRSMDDVQVELDRLRLEAAARPDDTALQDAVALAVGLLGGVHGVLAMLPAELKGLGLKVSE